MKKEDPCWWMILTVGVLVAVALGSWAIWAFFTAYISPVWTRVWAIAFTVAVPVVGRLCYTLGLTESRGKLVGIDQGIDKVYGAATRAIDLRSMAARSMPHTKWSSEPPMIALPEPPMIVRSQIERGEVIDL